MFFWKTNGWEPRPHLDKSFADLDGIGGRSLADLVAADEQFDAAAIFAAHVLADSADQHVILAAGFKRHGEVIFVAVVDEFDARGFLEDGADFIRGYRPLEFEVDRFA